MRKNGEEPHNSEVRFEKYALSFTCSVSWITSHVLPRNTGSEKIQPATEISGIVLLSARWNVQKIDTLRVV